MITIRDAVFPQDVSEITKLDFSVISDMILTPYRSGDQMGLKRVALASPITKRFPLDELHNQTRPWEFAIVATEGSRVWGFLAAAFHAWNLRVTIWHFYVDRPMRKRGVGRMLIDRVEAYGRGKGALNLWLETTSLNVEGVNAYRRLGFELCGLDTTLYQGTPSAGETALFFARPVKVEKPAA